MRIVKCRPGHRQQFERVPGFVYCGREFGGFAASPLGNPFRVGRDGTLDEVLARYRGWLWAQLRKGMANRHGDAVRVLEALAYLKADSVLGCWCLDKPIAGEGPDQCHCDVIARATAWLRKQGSTVSSR
jgi:hypothetical protein